MQPKEGWGTQFWKGTNIHGWAHIRGSDPDLLAQVRNAGDGGSSILSHIDEELAKLETHLPELKLHDAAMGRKLDSSLRSVKKNLATLRNGTPVGTRLLNSVINLAINWFPVLAPSPFLKNEPMTFAYTAAAAMNAMGMVGGSALTAAGSGRPVPFGGGVLGEQANEAHLYPWILGAQFLPSEAVIKYAKTHGMEALAASTEKFTGQTWWHALLGIAAFAALAQPLFGDLLAKGARATAEKVFGRPANQQADLAKRAAWGSEVMRNELTGSMERLRQHAKSFERIRRQYSAPRHTGPELTRAMNTRITTTLEEISSLSGRVQEQLGIEPLTRQQNSGASKSSSQRSTAVDTAKKLAYALLAGTFAVYTIVAVQPEVIATIDLSADAAVLIMAMMALVLNPYASAKDSKDRMLNMASTTITGAFAFTGDLVAKKGFPKKFPDGLMAKNPYIGAAIMMVLVALLPQHIASGLLSGASLAGQGLTRAYNAARRADTGESELPNDSQDQVASNVARDDDGVAQSVTSAQGLGTAGPPRLDVALEGRGGDFTFDPGSFTLGEDVQLEDVIQAAIKHFHDASPEDLKDLARRSLALDQQLQVAGSATPEGESEVLGSVPSRSV
jgi:hypothetical protein